MNYPNNPIERRKRTRQLAALKLPAGIDDPEVVKAGREALRLAAEAADASKALADAEKARDKAVQADLDAHVKAARSGKPDPGPAHQREAEERIETARRRSDALLIAACDAFEEMRDALSASAAEIDATLVARENAHRERMAELLAEFAREHVGMVECSTARGWVTDPDRPVNTVAGSSALPGVWNRAGEPIRMGQVIAALSDYIKGERGRSMTAPRMSGPVGSRDKVTAA